ncbi:MAG: hypothetical protein Q8O55_01810 [Dehalococcoidales bacterium]|nr:hypothetical protein [Dehalococcoidales bacterium]
MEVQFIPIWITSTASAIGVVYAIVRNGSRGKKQDEQLKTELKMEVKGIKDRLDDPDNGLAAIAKGVDSQRLHCAEVSTRIEAQGNTNSQEIATLRNKKK